MSTSWVQIELPQVTKINKVLWSRDRTGIEVTRTPIEYRIKIATATGEGWIEVASSKDREPYSNLIGIRPAQSEPMANSFQGQYWDREHGLPSNRVNDVNQTPEGYLWLATSRGLARFDGHQFKLVGKDAFAA